MESHSDKSNRSRMLLQAAAEFATPEEKEAFLCAVCGGEPALLADLLETVTLASSSASPLSHSPADALRFSEGEVVADRFQIVRRLGEGGMAVVYEAFDRKLGERRALKFPKLGHGEHIPQEARHALRVTHDNICRTHEIHTTNTIAGPADFLSMELVEGEMLLSRLRREPLTGTEALEVARQLCSGIEAAHGAKILHGDLKSNNVMLTHHADGSLRAVIMDFGLALPVVTGRRPDSAKLGGTPNYIAPERWKGGDATPACDVYALGVILYEMLTGRLPFAHGTPWPQRLSELPEPPSRSNRAPDSRWDRIVLGCLEPDPAKRLISASVVLQAIEHAFLGQRRRRWLVAAAVIVFALTPVAVFRERIWPPPLVRLAVLPFDGSAQDPAVDLAARGVVYDLAKRLESLGSASQRLVVIPVEDSFNYQVNPATATARLGATHILSGTLEARSPGFMLHAAITDTHTGVTLQHFDGEFRATDLAMLPTSLAGVVTAAFHLGRTPPVGIRAEAYPYYAAGLASLRAAPPDLERAVASFQESVKRDGSAVPALSGLADAFLERYRLGKDGAWLKAARESAVRAQSLQPDSPDVLLILGAIEQDEGRPERAIDLFRRAEELEPKNSDAWRRMGVALQSIGRDAEAVETLRRSVQLAPDYYAPHRALGVIDYRIGRLSEAVAEFGTVTRLAPELAEGFSDLGAALVALERDTEAEGALRKSVQLRATRGALNNLGVLLRFQGRDEEAVPVFEQALRAGADDAGLQLNLANALRRVGRIAAARGHFEKANDLARSALRNNPRDAIARARLAYSMVRLGATTRAGEEALQAARLSPSDYSVLFWAIMTLEIVGRREDAFRLLSDAPYERLRDLRRQPDLTTFVHDPGFLALLQHSQNSQLTSKRSNENVRTN